VRCNRCGKENPESLRFCQDCGNRLISGEVAGVAPTPPRGLAPAAPAPAAPPPSPAAPPRPQSVAPRPQSVAPPFFSPPSTFALSSGAPPPAAPAPRRNEASMRPAAPPFEFSQQGPPERKCTRCGTSNPLSGRFCSNCGNSLERPHEPSTAPQARAPAAPAAPTQAVPLYAAQPPPPPSTLMCPRCRGPNSLQMSFCQFCGARLAGSQDEGRGSAYGPSPGAANPFSNAMNTSGGAKNSWWLSRHAAASAACAAD